VAHVLNPSKDKGTKMHDSLILQEFKDAFPSKIHGIPPSGNINL
jgi:hypothetical protein